MQMPRQYGATTLYRSENNSVSIWEKFFVCLSGTIIGCLTIREKKSKLRKMGKDLNTEILSLNFTVSLHGSCTKLSWRQWKLLTTQLILCHVTKFSFYLVLSFKECACDEVLYVCFFQDANINRFLGTRLKTILYRVWTIGLWKSNWEKIVENNW